MGFTLVWKACASCLLLLVVAYDTALASPAPDPERLRAAMIYNLTKFVRWPSERVDDGRQLKLCVVGNDAVYQHLLTIEGKQVNGNTVVVEQLAAVDRGCHVLVLGETMPVAAVPMGVLTIGENERFLGAGGMISISVEKNRMVFDVNLAVARAGQLDISAEVLNLARSVQ